MEPRDILRFYSKPEVRKEIVDYSKGRWLALYTEKKGLRLFIRYWGRKERLLSINSENDFISLLGKYSNYGIRTIYATINIYRDLSRLDSVDHKDNIVYSTPIWDIDGNIEDWEWIIKIARIIVNALEEEGVEKSVYLKWSGRGVHIHIHERAFSKELLQKHHPLDIAYATVEYLLKKKREEIVEIIRKAPKGERELKVENEIDMKRIFTVPLSFHKYLDYIAVCFKPKEIESFSPEWAKPDNFRHNTDWRIYEEGEADNLAIKAIKDIGGYFEKVGEIRTIVHAHPKHTTKPRGKQMKTRVGRFQVMALLQAARYYLITGDLNKAKSFGLNRAIFYAWAKHYKPRIPRRTKITKDFEVIEKEGKKMVYLGNEGAYVSERGWFVIGDKEQKPEDFDKEIAQKIESILPFEKAWSQAIEYLKQFPKTTLLDQRKFYEKVYKPIRDNFFEIANKPKFRKQNSSKK